MSVQELLHGIDMVLSDYECPLCESISLDSVICCKDGHSCCASHFPNNQEQCPHESCTRKMEKLAVNIWKNKTLQDISLYCGTKMDVVSKCNWFGPIHCLKEHEDICEYVRIKCTNAACSEKVLRNSMVGHLSKCPYEIVECPLREITGCNQCMYRKDAHEHENPHLPNHVTGMYEKLLLLQQTEEESDDSSIDNTYMVSERVRITPSHEDKKKRVKRKKTPQKQRGSTKSYGDELYKKRIDYRNMFPN